MAGCRITSDTSSASRCVDVGRLYSSISLTNCVDSYREEMEDAGGNFPVDMELEDVDVLPVDIEEHDSFQSLSGNSSSKT